jgi:hypothetical protein
MIKYLAVLFVVIAAIFPSQVLGGSEVQIDVLRLTPTGYLYFPDGTWQNTAGITGVTVGGGLTTSGTTGDTIINIDTAVIQKRVTALCPAGFAIRDIGQSGGSATCEPTGVTGVLSITNGGTGSATQNFVDLSSTQTVAGTKTFSSNVTAPQLVSTVATGTTPLQVSSTTMVSNFNSEMIGGNKLSDLDNRYGVSTAPGLAPHQNSLTTVDGAASVGGYSSIAIGTDGFPVISYYDNTNHVLKVVKCTNASCSASNTPTTVDSTALVGFYTSITIGTDGFPVISYYDVTNGHLKVVKCSNASCSASYTPTTVDSGANMGTYTSIAIGSDGNPVISYNSVTPSYLKVAKCGNTACSGGTTLTTVDNMEMSDFTSITIGADGFPVIAYHDFVSGSLKLAKCGDAACSSNTILTLVEGGPSAGQYPAITIGTDGFPVISYYANYHLKVAKCVNQYCLNNWWRR